jgi:hypothetical protein
MNTQCLRLRMSEAYFRQYEVLRDHRHKLPVCIPTLGSIMRAGCEKEGPINKVNIDFPFSDVIEEVNVWVVYQGWKLNLCVDTECPLRGRLCDCGHRACSLHRSVNTEGATQCEECFSKSTCRPPWPHAMCAANTIEKATEGITNENHQAY